MQRILTIKGNSQEFLEHALRSGWLQGECEKRCADVASDNIALRHENTILKARLAEQRRVNKTYRRAHLEALKYQYDTETGWRYSRSHRWQMMFAACGLTAALMCLGFALLVSYC